MALPFVYRVASATLDAQCGDEGFGSGLDGDPVRHDKVNGKRALKVIRSGVTNVGQKKWPGLARPSPTGRYEDDERLSVHHRHALN